MVDTTFFESIIAFFNLDFGFFVDVALNNLFWVFAFLLVNHVLFKGRSLVPNFILFSVYIWSFREFGAVWHTSGFAGAPIFFFVAMVFWRIFVLDRKLFGNHTAFLDVCFFYGLVFVITFLLG